MPQTVQHTLETSPHLGGLGGFCRGRFAPSPTGRMHLGNVYSALIAWLSARSKGGEFVLRIEDIDPQRSRKEYADQIDDDLRWLGIDWDERYVQSERFHLYEQHLDMLREQGLIYPCYCTRADIMATQAPHESDGRVVYKGTCRPLQMENGKWRVENGKWRVESIEWEVRNGRRPSTRLVVPDRDVTFTDGNYGTHTVNLARECGDFIVRRADGAWAYQLAVVVDDALMGITEVVRGRDLLLSVPQQQYLFGLLGYPSPEFAHIPLLCNEAGQRLSKRDRSMDLGQLRDRYRPEELLGTLAHLAGIIPSPTPLSARELIPLFTPSNLSKEDVAIKRLGGALPAYTHTFSRG